MQKRNMGDFAPPPPSCQRYWPRFAYELTDQMSNYKLFNGSFECRAHGHRLRGQAWKEFIGLSLIC